MGGSVTRSAHEYPARQPTANAAIRCLKRINTLGERRLLALASNRVWQNDLSPFLFIVPALAVYCAFFIYPLVKLLELSLYKWDGILERKFVGLRHYGKLFSDERFWEALSHNFSWMIAAIIVPVLFGLLLAILLSRSSMYGSIIFRTISSSCRRFFLRSPSP